MSLQGPQFFSPPKFISKPHFRLKRNLPDTSIHQMSDHANTSAVAIATVVCLVNGGGMPSS